MRETDRQTGGAGGGGGGRHVQTKDLQSERECVYTHARVCEWFRENACFGSVTS